MKNNPAIKARKTIFTISAVIFAVCIMMAMMFSASASEVELGECSENNGSGHTIIESSKSIYTTITCNACGETLYKSDDRWHDGTYGYHHDDVYVEIGYGMIATFNDHYNSDDVLVAYYVADSIDGNEYEFNFDWAINQGYIDYGYFNFKLYHNGSEVRSYNFSEEPNPYDNVFSESYKYVAEGEVQVFELVFEKIYCGWWNDEGRTAFLNNVQHVRNGACEEHNIGYSACNYCDGKCQHSADGQICVKCVRSDALPAIDNIIFTANSGDNNLNYHAIWNAFPEEIQETYEGNTLYVDDEYFTSMEFFSYSTYESYQLTLVDGKWQLEFEDDVYEKGGMLYAYVGQWRTLYRGTTKESVLFDIEDKYQRSLMVEVMSHIFRVFAIRYIGDNSYSVDAYYNFDGTLDYMEVNTWNNGNSICVSYNANREATGISDGDGHYMFSDGNWRSGSSLNDEIFETPEAFVGMSFDEVASIAPCFIYCGGHEFEDTSCDKDQFCNICFDVIRLAGNHDFADATCTAPATCNGCGKTYGEPMGHGYDATDFPPDCENGGYTIYTCRNCGDSYTADEIGAFGHAHDAVVTAPDCENGGYTTYTCVNCGDSYVADETSALGHNFADATYDAPKTCYVCGETEGESLKKPEDTSESESELTTEVKTEVKTESETEVNSEVVTEEKTEATTEAIVESTPVATDDVATEAVSGGEADGEKSGCGSTIGVPIAIVAVIGFVGFSIYKKKKED